MRHLEHMRHYTFETSANTAFQLFFSGDCFVEISNLHYLNSKSRIDVKYFSANHSTKCWY